jgi:ParB-like chromosome segregation protein Spo0J
MGDRQMIDPVNNVQWIHSSEIKPNSYNPNHIARPEMELLKRSIEADGYTMPIVCFDNGGVIEIVDGFHRYMIGSQNNSINSRLNGYLPVVIIKNNGKNDRIASTIRHNRARGKHNMSAMSDIVIELKRRNWKTGRICKELGMDEDEVLRLMQVNGLIEMFSENAYSEAWEYET